MFDGCTALEYLILGPYVNLTGCNLQALPGHSTDDGTWCRQESSTDSWMGSGADLIKRYNGTGSEGEQLGAGAAIYFFDTSILRNVFDSNLNVWWQYNKKNQILLIGVNKNAPNVTITETFSQQPWLRVLGGGTTQAAYDAARAMIVRVDFRDLVTVLHPEHWFDGYTLMADAYVGNMDISQATSLQGVFNGCTSLSIISGLRNWDTTNVTDMSHLFDGCIFTNLAGIESWNDKLANVTDLSYIFANNPNVTTLENVAGWNLPVATNFCACLRERHAPLHARHLQLGHDPHHRGRSRQHALRPRQPDHLHPGQQDPAGGHGPRPFFHHQPPAWRHLRHLAG